MANRMLVSEMVALLVEKAGIPKSVAEQFCSQFFVLIREALLRDNYVKIKGLGTFKLMEVGGRESVDVNTGKRIEISAHSRIVFTPDKIMASRINRPFENFETVSVEADTNDDEKEAHSSHSEASKASVEAEMKGDMGNEVHTVFIGNDEKEEQEANPARKEDACETCSDEEEEDEEASHEDTDNESHEDGELETEAVEEENSPRRWRIWKILGAVVGVLFLMAGSYFVGYYKVLDSICDFGFLQTERKDRVEPAVTQKKPVEKIQKDVPEKESRGDSLSVSKDAESQEEQSRKFEQLPGGKYLIVGVLEEHELKKGENLTHLSRKVYGDKEQVEYVIFFNHITNPDLVPVGTKIRFPRLVEREKE